MSFQTIGIYSIGGFLSLLVINEIDKTSFSLSLNLFALQLKMTSNLENLILFHKNKSFIHLFCVGLLCLWIIIFKKIYFDCYILGDAIGTFHKVR
jgi:hypothetical protein